MCYYLHSANLEEEFRRMPAGEQITERQTTCLKQKGLINQLPDLNDLDDGDLKYKIDFKQVYATILHKWLQADDKAILEKQYDYLSFV